MKKRPNIIFFLTDQQRADSMGLHGNPLDLTPNLDRMAREHTHVASCFTAQPLCGPTRACLQTGMYASASGCIVNDIPLPTDVPLLGKCFRDGGYDTGYIGKWHLADRGNPFGPVPPEKRGGYDYWLAANVLEMTSEAYHTVLYDNDQKKVELPGYRVDAMTDAAIRYVTAPREKPFFLFFSLLEPHHQNRIDNYPAPDGYRERFTGRWTPPDLAALGGSSAGHLGGYWGMIRRIDEAYGRLHDALKSNGLAEDTIVVFTSDHGCHFKTRNDEYKRSCHEASIRVPGVITGPGFRGGGQIHELVSLVDFPPTLLEAAGIPVPKTMQGRPIQPLLHGRGATANWPEEVFFQLSEATMGRGLRTHRWKYSVTGVGVDTYARHAAAYTETQLYDLEADPHELTNLVDLEKYELVRQRLRQRLIERMTAIGEPRPEILPPEKQNHAGVRDVLPHEINQ